MPDGCRSCPPGDTIKGTRPAGDLAVNEVCHRGRTGGLIALLAILPVVGLGVAPVQAQFELPMADPFGGEEQPEGSFDVKRLQCQGVAGLTEVLDEMLPDTAEPKKLAVPEATVQQLLTQLGDDSYRVREAAMRRLSEIGDGARPLLVKAAKDPNAEISWRATRVLRGWEGRKYAEKAHLVGSFAQYLSGVRDESRLDELARRTKLALDHGLWGDSRGQVLQQCMHAMLRSEGSAFVDLLEPYLKHQDVQIAMLVTEAAAQNVRARGTLGFAPVPRRVAQRSRRSGHHGDQLHDGRHDRRQQE